MDSPWGCKELDTTERLSKEKKRPVLLVSLSDVQTKQPTVSEMLSSSAWQTWPNCWHYFYFSTDLPLF